MPISPDADDELDELSQEWLDALCLQIQHDDKLRSAVHMVSELYAFMCEGREIPSTHLPMLRQLLAAHGIAKVQEIGWFAKPDPGPEGAPPLPPA